jgi:HK97 family phage prohead protease
VDEYGAVRVSWNSAAHPRAPAGSATGGQFSAGSSSAAPTNARPVGTGETGKRVSDLQARLNEMGFKPPLKVDGQFGPKTLAAVRSFQKAHGLKVDGLVGPLTTAALRGKHPAQHTPAAPVSKVHRAAGQVTNPGDTERLHEYWVHGPGAAKVAWGTPGDFGRCVAELGKYIKDPQGYCNLAHHAALGYYPATHAAMEHAGRAAMATDTKAKPYGDVSYADPKNGKYPLDTEAHCRAAWSYINMPKNAAMYPLNGVTLSEVKDRIKAALKKYGADVSSDSSNGSSSRAEYMRLYPLEDIHILRSADGGDGRTVEAFAAVFDDPAEIQDHEGHYVETIDRAAFNKVIADASRARGGFPGSVKVLYNHGMTIQGTPSERFSMPIGVPVDIRAEQRGLLTRTRYSDTPLAEEILENIRAGSITSQSFTGRIVRSDPLLRRGDRHRPDSAGNLRTVRRTELGLREYGPVLWPAYSGAEILGVRMSTPGTWEPDEFDEALPPDAEAAAGEPLTRADGDGDEHSARYHQHQLYRMTSEEKRKAAGLVW